MNVFLATILLAQLSGSVIDYAVQRGDSLSGIGARFGVEVRAIAQTNGFQTSARLTPGQIVTIDNRHVVPAAKGASIVINVPQRMLFYFKDDNLTAAYPIAAGKPDWKTPLGEFEIATMEENPTWDVPPSIQEEMRRAGKPVLTRVPPCPQNPLGKFWMGLSLPGIGVHGTNAPSSIYKLATHGCIRLHPDDVSRLFTAVDVGTEGRVVYEPILLARVGDAILIEVHPDAYKKIRDPLGHALELARAAGVFEVLNLEALKEALKRKEGVPREIGK